MKNETGRPPERPATNSITTADDSKAVGPRLVIEISVEGQPRVRQEALNGEQSRRLEFWIKSQPHLHRLVHDAVRLSRDAA